MKKNNQGITMIALIIVIIAILLIGGISISKIFGDSKVEDQNKVVNESSKNILEESSKVEDTEETEKDNEIEDENEEASEDKENEEDEEDTEKISLEESYVGYYADVNGDGKVDGIIYADLAIGEKGSWWDEDYTVPKEDGVKDYYISQKAYKGVFGTNDVLSMSGTGNDRFFVMALTDFKVDEYNDFTWYGFAENYNSKSTSSDFGKGYNNTKNMISIWNDELFGPQMASEDTVGGDIWGEIQEEFSDGWFVPSKDEFIAFGAALEISSNNFDEYEISDSYWSSSLKDNYSVYTVHCEFGFTDAFEADSSFYVRLSTTF